MLQAHSLHISSHGVHRVCKVLEALIYLFLESVLNISITEANNLKSDTFGASYEIYLIGYFDKVKIIFSSQKSFQISTKAGSKFQKLCTASNTFISLFFGPCSRVAKSWYPGYRGTFLKI